MVDHVEVADAVERRDVVSLLRAGVDLAEVPAVRA